MSSHKKSKVIAGSSSSEASNVEGSLVTLYKWAPTISSTLQAIRAKLTKSDGPSRRSRSPTSSHSLKHRSRRGAKSRRIAHLSSQHINSSRMPHLKSHSKSSASERLRAKRSSPRHTLKMQATKNHTSREQMSRSKRSRNAQKTFARGATTIAPSRSSGLPDSTQRGCTKTIMVCQPVSTPTSEVSAGRPRSKMPSRRSRSASPGHRLGSPHGHRSRLRHRSHRHHRSRSHRHHRSPSHRHHRSRSHRHHRSRSHRHHRSRSHRRHLPKPIDIKPGLNNRPDRVLKEPVSDRVLKGPLSGPLIQSRCAKRISGQCASLSPVEPKQIRNRVLPHRSNNELERETLRQGPFYPCPVICTLTCCQARGKSRSAAGNLKPDRVTLRSMPTRKTEEFPTFRVYYRKVLRRIPGMEDMQLTNDMVKILDGLMYDFLGKVKIESRALSSQLRPPRRTLTVSTAVTCTKFLIPGELGCRAISRGCDAVHCFNESYLGAEERPKRKKGSKLKSKDDEGSSSASSSTVRVSSVLRRPHSGRTSSSSLGDTSRPLGDYVSYQGEESSNQESRSQNRGIREESRQSVHARGSNGSYQRVLDDGSDVPHRLVQGHGRDVSHQSDSKDVSYRRVRPRRSDVSHRGITASRSKATHRDAFASGSTKSNRGVHSRRSDMSSRGVLASGSYLSNRSIHKHRGDDSHRASHRNKLLHDRKLRARKSTTASCSSCAEPNPRSHAYKSPRFLKQNGDGTFGSTTGLKACRDARPKEPTIRLPKKSSASRPHKNPSDTFRSSPSVKNVAVPKTSSKKEIFPSPSGKMIFSLDHENSPCDGLDCPDSVGTKQKDVAPLTLWSPVNVLGFKCLRR